MKKLFSKRTLAIAFLFIGCLVAIGYSVQVAHPQGQDFSGFFDIEYMLEGRPVEKFAYDVRLTVAKMITFKNINVDDIRFNSPKEFEHLLNVKAAVFHPRGGGLKFQEAPEDVMENGKRGRWVFNAEFDFSDTSSASKGDIAGYLIGVTREFCQSNMKLGEKSIQIPRLNSDQSILYRRNMVRTETEDYLLREEHSPKLDHPTLNNKAIGCFQSYDARDFVYFESIYKR